MQGMLSSFADYTYKVVTVETTDTSWSSWWNDWGMMFFWIWLILAIVMIASMWRIFTKAGRPGWAAIVPIYNSLQLIWTAGKSWWWILLLCIPFVNIIAIIVLYYSLAKAFGKGVGYTLLFLFIPILGFPMLAWGSATYKLKKPKNGM